MREALILVAALLAFAPTATALPLYERWSDPDLGTGVAEGAATAETLWLRGVDHTGHRAVVRFDRATGAREVVAQGVLDLLQDGPRVWALSRPSAEGPLVVTDLAGAETAPVIDAVTPSEIAQGLFMLDGRPAVLTTEAVYARAADGWSRRALSRPLNAVRRSKVSLLAAGQRLYYSSARGEWGGTLLVIDPATGEVSADNAATAAACVEHVYRNGLCSQVTAFAPAAPHGCVLAATGLAHLSLRAGGVIELCGQEARLVFEARLPPEANRLTGGSSWDLRDIAATRSGWVASSEARLFRSSGGVVTETPMPPLREWAGLRINTDDPDVLVVLRACCWGSAAGELYDVVLVPVVR